MPPDAARCPSCGHQRGDVVSVEVGGHGGGGGVPSAVAGKRPRRRDGLLLAAVTVIVVGALAFAGRGGGGEKAAEDKPTPTTDPTTSTTERPKRTTTTTTTTTLKPLLLETETGVSLLVSRLGDFAVVDLDTGESHEITGLNEAQVIPTESGFYAGGGGGGPPSAVRYFAAPYDSDPVMLDVDDAGQLFESATPGRVWVMSYGETPSVSEFDASGQRTAGPYSIEVPNNGWFVAVEQGLVVTIRGGIFVMDLDDQSLRRIGYGDVLTARGSTVAAVGCDAVGACSVQLIDARTGKVRPVDMGDIDVSTSYYSASFSPDGSMLVLTWSAYEPSNDLPQIVVADLDRGTTRAFSIFAHRDCCGMPVSWSLDSNWLFWASGDTVMAWPRGADDPISIEPGRSPFSSVNVVG